MINKLKKKKRRRRNDLINHGVINIKQNQMNQGGICFPKANSTYPKDRLLNLYYYELGHTNK